jgi:hypothetical protein
MSTTGFWLSLAGVGSGVGGSGLGFPVSGSSTLLSGVRIHTFSGRFGRAIGHHLAVFADFDERPVGESVHDELRVPAAVVHQPFAVANGGDLRVGHVITPDGSRRPGHRS